MKIELPDLEPLEWLTFGLVVVTALLVLVTAYYAWQTRSMVEEMRAARGVQVLPRLVPSLHWFGPNLVEFRITNVGPGPALRVDATLTTEPDGWDVRWLWPLLVSGEAHDFYPFDPAAPPSSEMLRLPQLTERFERLHLRASYSDALGGPHATDETFDIRRWAAMLDAARHARRYDWSERTAKAVEELVKQAQRLVGFTQADRTAEMWRRSPEARRERWSRRVAAVPKVGPALVRRLRLDRY